MLGITYLTFAATEDIASFLRFFLLDTAVPILKWKQRWRGNSSFQKPNTDRIRGRNAVKAHAKQKKKKIQKCNAMRRFGYCSLALLSCETAKIQEGIHCPVFAIDPQS